MTPWYGNIILDGIFFNIDVTLHTTTTHMKWFFILCNGQHWPRSIISTVGNDFLAFWPFLGSKKRHEGTKIFYWNFYLRKFFLLLFLRMKKFFGETWSWRKFFPVTLFGVGEILGGPFQYFFQINCPKVRSLVPIVMTFSKILLKTILLTKQYFFAVWLPW